MAIMPQDLYNIINYIIAFIISLRHYYIIHLLYMNLLLFTLRK